MNAFATINFLDFASNSCRFKRSSGIFTLATSSTVFNFPYYITSSKKFSSDDFLITPICISGPQLDSATILRNLDNADLNISGGFIQTRFGCFDCSNFITSDKFVAFRDSRSNYRLDLCLTDFEYIHTMKRDARQRIRKLLKQFHGELKLNVGNTALEIEAFSLLYDETANRINFSSSYRFGQKDWKHLLASSEWQLYELQFKSKIIAACIVSSIENKGYDFTFMAHDDSFKDAPRLLIYYLRSYLRSICAEGFLDLGGGISENDSLAKFKSRLGSKKIPFERIRFMSKDFIERNRLDSTLINYYLQNAWP